MRWDVDPTQPKGATAYYYNGIAVDPSGNPAFVDTEKRIHYKKDGKWTVL